MLVAVMVQLGICFQVPIANQTTHRSLSPNPFYVFPGLLPDFPAPDADQRVDKAFWSALSRFNGGPTTRIFGRRLRLSRWGNGDSSAHVAVVVAGSTGIPDRRRELHRICILVQKRTRLQVFKAVYTE